jgi:hypothetical protein
MVNETAPVNCESVNGMSVAFPSITSTLLPRRREVSAFANFGSTSRAVSRLTDIRSRSVVTPGPGPSSKTFGPRSFPPRTHGTRC